MLRTSQLDYLQATGLSGRTVIRRHEGLPYARVGKARLYPLADVLPTLDRPGAAVRGLLNRAIDDGQVYVGGPGAIESARALEEWLLNNTDYAAINIASVRGRFFDGLQQGLRSSVLTRDFEALRLLILRSAPILRYVITSEHASLPTDWAAFARVFSVLHAGHEVAA